MKINYFLFLSLFLFFLIFLLFIRFIKDSRFSDKLLVLQYIELLACVFILVYGTFSEKDIIINIGLIFSLVGFLGIIFLNKIVGD